VRELAAEDDVVVVTTRPLLDGVDRVVRLEPALSHFNRLDLQTRAISHARAFVGTGDLTYLAAFVGVPSIALQSNGDADVEMELRLAESLFAGDGYGTFSRAPSTLGTGGLARLVRPEGNSGRSGS
jgi:hypothetical protein